MNVIIRILLFLLIGFFLNVGPVLSQLLPEQVVNAVAIMPGDTPEMIVKKAAHVRPSERQTVWQELEFTVFIHFGINTFTGREWGTRNEDPSNFNPSELDARQWAATAQMAGAKLLVMVAKHHDGFCLWPSEFTEFSVVKSPWKDGKGDVIGEVATACREAGIKLGIYLSPWDLNSPLYGTDKYNEYFKNQLRELLTQYGEVSEVWFDGACGEGPNGIRQVYDWKGYYEIVRELQPGAVVAVKGPDVRWVGTETGFGRETEWSVIPVSEEIINEIALSTQDSPAGYIFPAMADQMEPDLGSREKIMNAAGMIWYPSEVDVSIRPGWFYHAEEDPLVKSPQQLMEIYLSSVGRNAVLLLNIPPDRRGLIPENDVKSLAGFSKIKDSIFAVNLALGISPEPVPHQKNDRLQTLTDGDPLTYWSPDENTACSVTLDLGTERRFTLLQLQENYRNGQRVEEFTLEALIGQEWQEIARGTSIGYKRIIKFNETNARKIRLNILSSRDNPEISGIGIY